jgi:hypothetical protein
VADLDINPRSLIMSCRVNLVALGLCIVLAAGCEKSGTTGGSGTGSAATGAPAPAKGGGDEAYSKKLVGVWEGKEDLGGKEETATMEFKGDGTMSITMGPFELAGTWKLVKEDGKTLTVDTALTPKGFPDPKGEGKPDKKSFSIVFDNADTITMSKLEGKSDAKTFKRKK